MYRAEDAEETVSALSGQMLYTCNKAKILREIYTEALVDIIDV